MNVKTVSVVVLFSGLMSFGCDVEDGQDDPRVVEIADADEEDQEQEAQDSWTPEFGLSDASKPASGSGGVSPQKRCCVKCSGDNWAGWWDLGTGNTPKCNDRAPKWCHEHNWNFGDAEWFYQCPTG